MLEKFYLWLFNMEERKPIGFVYVFFLSILVSFVISLFVVAVDRHVQGWVEYLWQ